MKGNVYTLVYAAVLGTVCALVLTFAASFMAPYKQANAEAEEVKNILLALSVSIPDKASSEELVKIYKENVR
jgi:Na+-transporting NADH:ubiquinone oxidoreductase subunit NqrC